MSLLTEIASRIKTRIQNHSITLSQIANNLITFAKVQTIGAGKLLGNSTGSAGNISELDINDYKNYLIPLATTIADCENTTTAINIVSVVVPVNKLNVGDIIKIEFAFQRLQNRGSSNTLFQRCKINSNNIFENSLSISTNSTIFNIFQSQVFIVTSISGDNITLKTYNNTATAIVTNSLGISLGANGATNGVSLGEYILSSIDSTNEITIDINMNWNVANINSWVRIDQAQAYIIKKAV